jgi:hypothetical protein
MFVFSIIDRYRLHQHGTYCYLSAYTLILLLPGHIHRLLRLQLMLVMTYIHYWDAIWLPPTLKRHYATIPTQFHEASPLYLRAGSIIRSHDITPLRFITVVAYA